MAKAGGIVRSVVKDMTESNVSVERCVILTGMSGGGKSTALHMLEDQGFFAIDNIPPRLLTDLIEILSQHRSARNSGVAAVIDVRGEPFLVDFERIVTLLRSRGIYVTVVFIDASNQMLIRRFEATRRKHPLSDGKSLIDGIKNERKMLLPVKELSDIVIDTSGLTVREFRSDILSRLGLASSSFSIILTSFGFKYGSPQDVDFLFDVRSLPNPYYISNLRMLSGLDIQIQNYLRGFDVTIGLFERIKNLLDFIIPEYKKIGKMQVHIAIGCTGGRHRSVAMTQWLADAMESATVTSRHRDLQKDMETEGGV